MLASSKNRREKTRSLGFYEPDISRASRHPDMLVARDLTFAPISTAQPLADCIESWRPATPADGTTSCSRPTAKAAATCWRNTRKSACGLSLIQSARMNGHDPHACPKGVLTRLPAQREREIGQLMPICGCLSESRKVTWVDACNGLRRGWANRSTNTAICHIQLP